MIAVSDYFYEVTFTCLEMDLSKFNHKNKLNMTRVSIVRTFNRGLSFNNCVSIPSAIEPILSNEN